MATPSEIYIALDGDEITDRVVYDQTTFTSQANPMQGEFRVTVRDIDQDFSPRIGAKLVCLIDGVPLFGGYLLRVRRGNFLPAVSTSPPEDVRSRRWVLEGPDYNVLFDKRVLRDESDPTSALEVPAGKRTITKAFTHLMENFIDVPDGLDYISERDFIDTHYGTDDNGGLYVGQGKIWRDQMDDFADNGAIIYYIDGEFRLHLHEYESVVSPWVFVDVTGVANSVRFREGEYVQDFNRVATEALVWGGSSIRPPGGPGGDIVFAKYPDPPVADATWHGALQSAAREQGAVDRRNLYGRWQIGEEHAGQANYLTLGSVKNRAFVIINGVPGAVPTNGIEGGFSAPLDSMNLTWFGHDVPGAAHVRPGHLQQFILYTQGNDGVPLVKTLPCRSMRISFPTLPTDNPGGQTYVRFDGEFGTSYSDSRHLWKWLRKNSKKTGTATVVVTNVSDGAPPGSLATVWPTETADGEITAFTYPFTFYQGQFDLFLNGLFQRPGVDYSYSAATKQVTFITPPGIGDQQWATGYVSE